MTSFKTRSSGRPCALGLRLDLALDQLLANEAGANRHRGDAVLGAFQCQRLHESEDAMLCGHVAGLEQQRNQRMRGGQWR